MNREYPDREDEDEYIPSSWVKWKVFIKSLTAQELMDYWEKLCDEWHDGDFNNPLDLL